MFPAMAMALTTGCATVPEQGMFRARGEGPDWSLSIGQSEIRFSSPENDQPMRFPLAAHARSQSLDVWTSSVAGKEIRIEAGFDPQAPCMHDPRGPNTVRVVMNGREYRGCGGVEILISGD